MDGEAYHRLGAMIAVACLGLLLGACVTSAPMGYTRQASEGIYPAGELSGSPTYFVGWKWKLPLIPDRHWP